MCIYAILPRIMIRSLYIHIPFCNNICWYCDFARRLYDEKTADEYLNHLEKELAAIGPRIDESCMTFNLLTGKPYFVELSHGVISVKLQSDLDFTKLLEEVDVQLYEDKKLRRKSIRRELYQ